MHDWTLLSVNVNWAEGSVSVAFDAPTGSAFLKANDLHDLRIPRVRNWGPSVSVYEAFGPSALDEGLTRFSIEMQTGDRIEIVARSFELPAGYLC
jgi:hypothetical protein